MIDYGHWQIKTDACFSLTNKVFSYVFASGSNPNDLDIAKVAVGDAADMLARIWLLRTLRLLSLPVVPAWRPTTTEDFCSSHFETRACLQWR
eukprot:5851434-Pleurochrysis_carterae.AAC.1